MTRSARCFVGQLDWVVAVAVFALGCVCLVSLPGAMDFDPDEGFNLAKARLVADGFRLYDEIWSDQPPLFTWALAGWWKLGGDSLAASRALVLLCSSVLLLCVSRLVRLAVAVSRAIRAGGETGSDAPPDVAAVVAGLLALLLLLGSSHYTRLSVSVMIGLPAVALAAASLWMLARAAATRRSSPIPAALAALAGVGFAASLHTKFFTIAFLPVAVAILMPRVRRRLTDGVRTPGQGAPRDGSVPAAFVVGLTGGFVALAAFSFAGHAEQVIAPHVGASPLGWRLACNLARIARFLGADPSLAIVAALGIAFAVVRRQAAITLPLVLLACSVASLLLASPVWWHHRLLLYVPLAAAAGIGLTDVLFANAVTPQRRRVVAATALVAVVVGLGRAGWHGARLKADAVAPRPEVLAILAQHRGSTRWLLTDSPLYAHVAGLRVPPELAVLSLKRVLASGGRKGIGPVLLEVLQRRQPELILLARFRPDHLLHADAERYVASHYETLADIAEADGAGIRLYRLRTDPPSQANRDGGHSP